MPRSVPILCVKTFFITLLVLLVPTLARAQCGPWGCRLPSPPPAAAPPAVSPPAPLVPVPPLDEPPAAVTRCYHSIVRVRCGNVAGSGTYLGNRLVITCQHVARNSQGPLTITFPNGQTIQSTLLASDPASDIALLELGSPAPSQSKGISLAAHPAQLGQLVFSAGYGTSDELSISPGRITNLNQLAIACDPISGARHQRATTEASGLTEPGDSGGAWLTEQGELLGVVWGGRSQDHSVNATTQLADFLHQACNRWRRPFPRPDADPPQLTPAPPALPLPPPVNLAPLERRLDAIDGRLATLENPPKKKNAPLADGLAIAAGLLGGAILFFRSNQS